MTTSSTKPRGSTPTAAARPGPEPLLIVTDLSVTFADSVRPAVDRVSFSVSPGEVLGVAGESGSGKTSIALAALGLLPPDTRVTGSIRFGQTELVGLRGSALRAIRGGGIAMVFQESVTALHPMRKIGSQLTRILRSRTGVGRAEALAVTTAALEDVQLDPGQVLAAYPHELSGGMCQRVMIAMALSCGAKLILADEPTTALDVSLQKDVLVLLRDLVDTRGISIIFVSHDLGVLGEVCDRVMVMYRGEVKEVASTREMLAQPAHPYAQALLSCVPRMNDQRLEEFPEIVSDDPRWSGAGGCNFLPRCPLGDDRCTEHPMLKTLSGKDSHLVRCWRPAGVAFATIPVRASTSTPVQS